MGQTEQQHLPVGAGKSQEAQPGQERSLPRGAWKFPCSTGAELEVPDAAVVTSNPIDKVSPVARTVYSVECAVLRKSFTLDRKQWRLLFLGQVGSRLKFR